MNVKSLKLIDVTGTVGRLQCRPKHKYLCTSKLPSGVNVIKQSRTHEAHDKHHRSLCVSQD